MKRITAIFLVLAVMLSLLLSGCGCSKKPATDPTGATGAPTEATVPMATLPPQEASRHPLTGEKLAEPWSGQIVAVMVNNVKPALPQYGLSQADVIYEIEEEGSATRNMALYSDVSKIGPIGSIRSTRSYFVSVAAAYDAYLVHCGTSTHAEKGGYDANGNKLTEWKHIDEQRGGNGEYFYRDQGRKNAGYATEHTLFTSGEKLAKALEGKALSVPKTGFVFKEGAQLAGGEVANEIKIKFKGTKTTSFTYNATTAQYERSQFGAASKDAGTEQVEAVKNVIVLYTKQWYCPQGHGHQYYDTIGSGEGYAAVNGKIVPIKWSRTSVDAPYIYTLADGSPLELDVGRSYISIVGEKFPIEYK